MGDAWPLGTGFEYFPVETSVAALDRDFKVFTKSQEYPGSGGLPLNLSLTLAVFDLD